MNELQLNHIPTSKAGQRQMAATLVAQIADGEADPLATVAKAKSLSEVLTAFLKDSSVTQAVLKECQKYGRGERPSASGALFQPRETGVKYDYTHCGDPVWQRLSAEAAAAAARLREREQFLQALRTPQTVVDDDTGEVSTIYPPARTSTTSYAILFNKE